MALALDGATLSVVTNGVQSGTVTLTTANAPGVILLFILNDQTAVPGTPTASGLTFVQQGTSAVNATGAVAVREYAAPYTSNFSGTISMTFQAGAFGSGLQMGAMGISGAATSSFRDPNLSGPSVVSTTATTCSLTTTNANDFLVFMYQNQDTPAVTAGWTNVVAAASLHVWGYQIVSATGTYTATTSINSQLWCGVMDAIIAAPPPASGNPYAPWSQQAPLIAQKRQSVGWLPLADHRRRIRHRGLIVPRKPSLIIPRNVA